MRRTLLLALVAAAAAATPAQAAWTVRAPGGELTARVARDGDDLVVRAGALRARLRVGRGGPTTRGTTVHRRFETPAGKRRSHRLDARIVTLAFGDRRRVDVLVARDGIAIRRRHVGEPRFAIQGRAWLQRYASNYERAYTATEDPRGQYGFPALLHQGGDWALLTEAGLTDDGAARLTARGGSLRVSHGQVRGMSPWRVAVLGGLDDVVASSLPLALGRPSRIDETSWIRPGRVAWSWWSDSTSPQRLETQQAYVDAAAARGWEYVLVDEGWDAAWVPQLVEYAAARGVRILLWTHWRALRDRDERARLLDRWRAWGVAGVKADFLHSDRRARLKAYDAIARAAARRRLVVNFHGSTVPRGLQRTWPNVLTAEAVLGAEHGKASPIPAAHDVNLVFTRNAIGSMDYTPVAFSAPNRTTTAAHQLALAVAFESGLQHLADQPAAYDARPAADELLKALPVAWDDTRLLGGAPDDHATLARRHGSEWWVADVHAGPATTRTVPLTFLENRPYTATLVADDGADGFRTSTSTVTAADTLTVPVAADGGFTLRLRPGP